MPERNDMMPGEDGGTLFASGMAAAAKTMPAKTESTQNAAVADTQPAVFEAPKNKVLIESLPVKMFNTDILADIENAGIAGDEFQEILDIQAEYREAHMAEKQMFRQKVSKAGRLIFIAVCLYMVFLTYGAITTQFVYNSETGHIYPQLMSVDELKYAAQFNGLFSYYIRARNLYEEILTLDVKLRYFPEDALFISTEYEALLDTVAKLTVDLTAEAYDTSYTQIYGQLLYWIQTESAVYVQNMSAAIAQGDIEKAENAIISRERMYNGFMVLTENMALLGKTIKGAETGDIYSWSPEKYVNDTVMGYGGVG